LGAATSSGQADRAGVTARFPEPAVQSRMAVDLPRIDASDCLVPDLARELVSTAKAPEAQTFDRLRASPSMGQLRALVLRYELHGINRFPRGQDFVAFCRLVTCAKASAGTRDGPSGTTIGKASLTGAFSDAAVVCLRQNPAGHKSLARFERRHSQGEALTVLAHTWARRV
jgi:transposase